MKRKATVIKSETPLEDLEARINQFIELNNIARHNVGTRYEKLRLEAQNSAFDAVLVLIGQLRKRGAIWKGGYLDNVGVVYEDQVQAAIDSHHNNQATAIHAELDERVRLLVESED